MGGRPELFPSTVPARAQQDGEAAARRERWAWAEPGVWTDRMLAALEDGVRGGVWFRLIDKVWLGRNLDSAWRRVEGNGGAAGVDHVTVDAFGSRVGANLGKLADDLRGDRYRPQDIRRAYIPKPGSSEGRPPGIPTVRDRVAQGAVRHVLEPIFERDFAAHSYGFRPGRGCKDALRRVDELLKQGYSHVVDADLKAWGSSRTRSAARPNAVRARVLAGLSGTSTARCGAGSATSSTAGRACSGVWTGGCACACGAFCVEGRRRRAAGEAAATSDGRTHSLPGRGCSR